jgi:hypothetical protein
MSDKFADRRVTPVALETQSWHLDKKVPLSLIFAMLVQCGMVIVAVGDIKKEVEVLKARFYAQREKEDKQERAVSETFQLLREQLNRMDMKLDRIAEARK